MLFWTIITHVFLTFFGIQLSLKQGKFYGIGIRGYYAKKRKKALWYALKYLRRSANIKI